MSFSGIDYVSTYKTPRFEVPTNRKLPRDVIEIRRRTVQRLINRKDWKTILQFYDEGHFDEGLSWISPSHAMIEFIAEEIEKAGVSKISSIGCGGGLLEWMISAIHPGIEITGYDVDEAWWTSDYSPPRFIDLKYVVDELPTIPADQAMMFCYFNSEKIFEKYLEAYKGPCLMIIGPAGIPGRYSEPEPLQLQEHPDWKLESWHNIRDDDDVVAVYHRRQK